MNSSNLPIHKVKAQPMCMKYLLSLFLLTFTITLTAHSQGYIHMSKVQVKKQLERYTTKENLQTIITETDTTLSFSVRDTSVQNLDILLSFEESGKCIKQQTKLSCDSCFQKFLNPLLNNKRYKWTRVNERTYVSGFSKKRLLVTDATNHSYSISLLDISRTKYKEMLETKTAVN
jgi:hypothetical protein